MNVNWPLRGEEGVSKGINHRVSRRTAEKSSISITGPTDNELLMRCSFPLDRDSKIDRLERETAALRFTSLAFRVM